MLRDDRDANRARMHGDGHGGRHDDESGGRDGCGGESDDCCGAHPHDARLRHVRPLWPKLATPHIRRWPPGPMPSTKSASCNCPYAMRCELRDAQVHAAQRSARRRYSKIGYGCEQGSSVGNGNTGCSTGSWRLVWPSGENLSARRLHNPNAIPRDPADQHSIPIEQRSMPASSFASVTLQQT